MGIGGSLLEKAGFRVGVGLLVFTTRKSLDDFPAVLKRPVPTSPRFFLDQAVVRQFLGSQLVNIPDDLLLPLLDELLDVLRDLPP